MTTEQDKNLSEGKDDSNTYLNGSWADQNTAEKYAELGVTNSILSDPYLLLEAIRQKVYKDKISGVTNGGPLKLLDLGCNDGTNSRRMSIETASLEGVRSFVFGLDVSQKAIDQANRKLVAHKLGLDDGDVFHDFNNLFLGKVNPGELPEVMIGKMHYVELAFVWQVLGSVEELSKTLTLASSALTDGGTLAILGLNPEPIINDIDVKAPFYTVPKALDDIHVDGKFNEGMRFQHTLTIPQGDEFAEITLVDHLYSTEMMVNILKNNGLGVDVINVHVDYQGEYQEAVMAHVQNLREQGIAAEEFSTPDIANSKYQILIAKKPLVDHVEA